MLEVMTQISSKPYVEYWEKWKRHWNQCFNVGGDYFKGTIFNEIYLVRIFILFNQSENFLNRPHKSRSNT
jgi:hypothetical protein